jgi:AcrR family transcriptional regulator
MSRQKTISDEDVLEGAARVMFAAGPEFTLAQIGKATGLAPATLLQRFGDKRALTVAAIAHDNKLFAKQLDRLPDARGEAAVLAVFRLLTPDNVEPENFGTGLLWLRQDMRDPDLNRLARDRFRLLRKAVAARMPRLAVAPAQAARLIDAQWQGAMNQWGIQPEGRLGDFIARSLKSWFRLAGRLE